jgi:hypothetical protein
MPAPINLTVPNLPAFQGTLLEYIRQTKKLPSEVIAKKGVDLRIKMSQGMKRLAWKRGRKGGAMREQMRRFRQGKGALVRDRQGRSPGNDKKGRPLNRWQSSVKNEMERRERGVGVLSATFIDRRWRRARTGRFLSQNTSRTFGTILITEQTADTFHMTATTPGVSDVATRYGVVRTAMEQVRADTEKYLTRKANEAAQAALSRYK